MIAKLKVKIYNFLRWTEKWIKTDMIYLTKGGFWLTVGQFFASLSAFLLSIAFANFLSKDDYGIYKYVLSIVGILMITNLRGINVSITQSVAQGNEGTAAAGIKTKIRWGLLGGLLAIIAGGYYFFRGNNILGTLLIITAPFLPLKDSYSAYGAILNGKKDFRRLALYGIIPNIVNAAIIAAVLFLTRSIYFTIFFYFASWTFTNFLMLKMTFKAHQFNDSVDQKSITYGKHVSVMNIISTIAGYFDKLLIFHLLGAASVAVYSIAMAPVTQLNGIIGNINPLASPKFSEQTTDNLKKSLKNKVTKIFYATFAIAAVYILLTTFLFKIFFPKYGDSVLFSQVLALSIPFTIISRFRITALQSRFDKNKLYFYTWSSSILQIVLISLGGYFYGLLGIAISDVIVSVIQYAITSILIKKL
jgi:O-antigen/teichoic acid export membrane protein